MSLEVPDIGVFKRHIIIEGKNWGGYFCYNFLLSEEENKSQNKVKNYRFMERKKNSCFRPQ
jgi:hypothetical protein